MQYIGDLDWHTLRLGALHVLASVGERSIDTREALLTRFQNILLSVSTFSSDMLVEGRMIFKSR